MADISGSFGVFAMANYANDGGAMPPYEGQYVGYLALRHRQHC